MIPSLVKTPTKGKMRNAEDLFDLAERLFPIPRSLSGKGVIETFEILGEHLPDLQVGHFESDSLAFDWTVPKAWEVHEAYVVDPEGKKILDFKENNLHLVGYSEPFEGQLTLEELQKRLHSLPDQPEAIPYVTSYYSRTWGFCISHKQRQALRQGDYFVRILSELSSGELPYGEVLIPGKSKSEIVLSTYVCHPSMANNEVSGPVVTTAIMSELANRQNYYSVRALFLPETIGSLAYMSKHLTEMKENVIAGYVVTCVGDQRHWSLLKSRNGNTLADYAAEKLLKANVPNYIEHPWTARGSDERQYCSPGADLPFASIMRSKYGTYPEYHTNLDRLGTVVTGAGLQETTELLLKVIEFLDTCLIPQAMNIGEPQMSRRGLYPTVSIKGGYEENQASMLDVLSLSDGKTSLNQIAERLQIDFESLIQMTDVLKELDLLTLR